MAQEVWINTLDKNGKVEWKEVEDIMQNQVGILKLKFILTQIKIHGWAT